MSIATGAPQVSGGQPAAMENQPTYVGAEQSDFWDPAASAGGSIALGTGDYGISSPGSLIEDGLGHFPWY